MNTENPQTTMNTKTEKPKFFGTKTEKQSLKNSQKPKTENPNAPLLSRKKIAAKSQESNS